MGLARRLLPTRLDNTRPLLLLTLKSAASLLERILVAPSRLPRALGVARGRLLPSRIVRRFLLLHLEGGRGGNARCVRLGVHVQRVVVI